MCFRNHHVFFQKQCFFVQNQYVLSIIIMCCYQLHNALFPAYFNPYRFPLPQLTFPRSHRVTFPLAHYVPPL